jgi:TetR/AcrR family transcriptional repressor of mexJK operon
MSSPTKLRTSERGSRPSRSDAAKSDSQQIDGDGRSARKHQAIMDAATALFLRDGYRSTSMDQIAADATVSKQTVYKHFEDKEQLFREIVLGVTHNSDAIIADFTSLLNDSEVASLEDLRTVLTDLARHYIDAVLEPRVLSLRRLIIAEAERFPDLARIYFELAPSRGMEVIADAFRYYEKLGLLSTTDARLAAGHFAYLALGIPLDKAQFCPQEPPSSAERELLASEAARVFLAAYECSKNSPAH